MQKQTARQTRLEGLRAPLWIAEPGPLDQQVATLLGKGRILRGFRVFCQAQAAACRVPRARDSRASSFHQPRAA